MGREREGGNAEQGHGKGVVGRWLILFGPRRFQFRMFFLPASQDLVAGGRSPQWSQEKGDTDDDQNAARDEIEHGPLTMDPDKDFREAEQKDCDHDQAWPPFAGELRCRRKQQAPLFEVLSDLVCVCNGR